MSEHGPGSETEFFVSPEHASAVLMQCADITISLDDSLKVVRFFCSFEFDASKMQQWVGREFKDCVATDSTSKIDYLFLDNCASSEVEGRWRHLNLCIDGRPDLPLLIKYFCFDDAHGVTRLLCARDLRPLLGMQKRFQREVDMMGHENSKLEQKLKFLQ